MGKKPYLKKMIKTVVIGFAFLGILGILPGIEKANKVEAIELKATDLERIGPGTEAPEFNLESVEKTLVKLSSYRNRKNVILIFYRGYW